MHVKMSYFWLFIKSDINLIFISRAFVDWKLLCTSVVLKAKDFFRTGISRDEYLQRTLESVPDSNQTLGNEQSIHTAVQGCFSHVVMMLHCSFMEILQCFGSELERIPEMLMKSSHLWCKGLQKLLSESFILLKRLVKFGAEDHSFSFCALLSFQKKTTEARSFFQSTEWLRCLRWSTCRWTLRFFQLNQKKPCAPWPQKGLWWSG